MLVLLTACSDGSTEETEPTGSIAPTEEAMSVNDELLLVPSGYRDCGITVTTSGWPTTTAYNAEYSAGCIVESAESGTAAQYAYWGRDGGGGLQGVIVRVADGGSIELMEYHIDSTGVLDGVFDPCSGLVSGEFEPPVCAA